MAIFLDFNTPQDLYLIRKIWFYDLTTIDAYARAVEMVIVCEKKEKGKWKENTLHMLYW